jgi:hypothetical protein
MNKINFMTGITIFLLSFLLSSCELAMVIFNAGMGVGILAIIAISVVIGFVVMKMGKK